MKDCLKITGKVHLTLTYFDGRKEEYHLDNMVVNGGKTIVARMLGNDASYADEYINTIAFGTGSNAPSTSDTALQTQVFEKAATVSFPAFNQVQYAATMLASEGNGNTFQEVGLLTEGSDMLFSRLLIGAIAKTSLYAINVEWTLSIQ